MSKLRSLSMVLAGCCLVCLQGLASEEKPWEQQVPRDWRYALDKDVAQGEAGMVATDSRLATEVGLAILKQGGNAIDAAIATAFSLAVVLPEAGNIGGGGFMTIRSSNGELATLDFREVAPLAASRDMYQDAQGQGMELSITGHLAVGVPGSVAGLWAAHQRFGSLPWEKLLMPAIQLAQQGFSIDTVFAQWTAREQTRHAQFTSSARLFLREGQPLQAGFHWRNPELAQTLKRLAAQGSRDFYQGQTADLMIAEMQRGNGIISHQDLKSYQPVWRQPLQVDLFGHRLVTMPPPSSGGITVALIVALLEWTDWQELPWYSEESLHLLAEAMRRAFAVRNTHLGDPQTMQISIDELLADRHVEALAAGLDAWFATPSRNIISRPGALRESQHTTHFSIVDGFGNAISVTTTINTSSAVTVTGAGFLLNNEMDDFTARPGSPNVFGLVQGESNAIIPGRRMLSSMMPSIVLDAEGLPVMVTGASGGPTIITGSFQVMSNFLLHSLPLRVAVNAPRVHHQHLPDQLFIEPRGLTETIRRQLTQRGHQLSEMPWVGRAATVVRVDGKWQGVADPRIGGMAAGY